MSEPKAAAVMEQALRDNANRMLALLPAKQRDFFHRIEDSAPWKGWANCPMDRGGKRPLIESHDLLCRSVDNIPTLHHEGPET